MEHRSLALYKGGSHEVIMVLWKPLVCVGAGIIIFNSPGILGSLATLYQVHNNCLIIIDLGENMLCAYSKV